MIWVFREMTPDIGPGVGYSVGYYDPQGLWVHLSLQHWDYEAAALVSYLNGGDEPTEIWSF
jgi:hypothetical protein